MGSVNSPSTKGVKRTLDELVRTVAAQGEEMAAMERRNAAKGSNFEELLAAMEARISAHIEDVRKEMRATNEARRAEIAQLQEHVHALQGEQGILKEQTTDSHRTIRELSKQLDEINVEIMGEE